MTPPNDAPMPDVEKYVVKSNGCFGLLEGPFDHMQHPNQQGGLDKYVRVINFNSGEECLNKLYENTKGLHFKQNGTHYLSEFDHDCLYVPFQIMDPYTRSPRTPAAKAEAQPEGEAGDTMEAFEKYFKGYGLDFTKSEYAWGKTIYKHTHIDAMWAGWQAAKSPTPSLESAVKACKPYLRRECFADSEDGMMASVYFDELIEALGKSAA